MPLLCRMALQGRTSSLAFSHGPRASRCQAMGAGMLPMAPSARAAFLPVCGRSQRPVARRVCRCRPGLACCSPTLALFLCGDVGTINRAFVLCTSPTRIKRTIWLNRAPVAAIAATSRNRSPSQPCSASISRVALRMALTWTSVRIWLPRASGSVSSSTSIARRPCLTMPGSSVEACPVLAVGGVEGGLQVICQAFPGRP